MAILGDQVEQNIAQKKFERTTYRHFEMSFPKPRCLDRAIVLSIGPTLYETAQLLGVGDYVAQISVTRSQYMKHQLIKRKGLFWLMVFNTPLYALMAPMLLVCSKTVQAKPLTT